MSFNLSGILNAVLSFVEAEALSVWSKVSGSINVILNEIPDDEITILHNVMAKFADDLKAGKPAGEAAADAWAVLANAEGGEVSKVTQAVLDVFITSFESKK
jgi:hypothetical protein